MIVIVSVEEKKNKKNGIIVIVNITTYCYLCTNLKINK